MGQEATAGTDSFALGGLSFTLESLARRVGTLEEQQRRLMKALKRMQRKQDFEDDDVPEGHLAPPAHSPAPGR